jgi:hypothetical protein
MIVAARLQLLMTERATPLTAASASSSNHCQIENSSRMLSRIRRGFEGIETMVFPGNDVTRYCAVAYFTQERASAENVITILVELRSGAWKLLVRHGWRKVVASDDQRYVGELLADMKSRISVDPNSLFQQLSSLSVGPLITHSVGGQVHDNPQMAVMLRNF